MGRKLLTIGGVLAVIVALLLFWQLSQNGRYAVVDVPREQVVLVVDTRSGAVFVRALEVDGDGAKQTFHYYRVMPAETKSPATR
jgi:hypothetical protein